MAVGFDMVIVGGGPAGLSLACLVADLGLRVAVVERQSERDLAEPASDGRDIALTHRSVRILREMGVWDRVAPVEVAPIRRAAVRNADEAQLLTFAPQAAGHEVLGYLVSNHVLRREIFGAARQRSNITLRAGEAARRLEIEDVGATITLASGERLQGRLVIAADSRFSELRRMAGIGAEMRDFGHLCIVCRLQHEQPHDGTAYEWFDVDQTLAVLPLNGCSSSIVLTQPACFGARTLELADEDFAAQIERRLAGRWGGMALDGKRHAYPLVAVYAHRFSGKRVALIGDAAVGMHPVTAHGFNFGLRGAETLAGKIGAAAKAGGDIGEVSVLDSYAREHRSATLPLYLATNAIVRLYTDNTMPARLIRGGLLRVANMLSPAKDFMLRKLTEIDGGLASAEPASMQRGLT
ncbi:MAG: 5-demethoxyubiquinol-8 5-hydroxylase UbiM [Hyphomicrobium sp.]